MICQRCGQDISDTTVICPSCGTTTSTVGPTASSPRAEQPPSYGYNTPPQGNYAQGYGPMPGYTPPPRQPHTSYQPNPGYNLPPGYQMAPINVNVYNNPIGTQKNTGALITEILLSFFLGIYGVGWLMAGETTVGVILLICSFFYWAITFFIAIVTFLIGLSCWFPFAIVAVIINAILLNNKLNSKVQQIVVMQGPQMPPQYPPQRPY